MLTICGIDHVVLRVGDIERMRKFYCDVLGAQHVAWRPELGIVSHLRKHGVQVGKTEGNAVELKGPSDGKPVP